MASEYKLSYTGEEIDIKLGEIDSLMQEADSLIKENDIVSFTEEEINNICDLDSNLEGNIIPKATKTALGCVIIGDGLNVDSDGKISANIEGTGDLDILDVTSSNTLTWDGNVENRFFFDASSLEGLPAGTLIDVKISSDTPTLEQLNAGVTISYIYLDQEHITEINSFSSLMENVYIGVSDDVSIPLIAVAIEDIPLGDANGTVAPKGVYFLKATITDEGVTVTLTTIKAEFRGYEFRKEIIKEEYLPEGLGGSYTHPSTHPATMIVEDSTHRFVTDNEKAKWNDKIGISGDGYNAEVFNGGSSIGATGEASHVEGKGTTASGYGSHSEGIQTSSGGTASHAEGFETAAIGSDSHAEGDFTIAFGGSSHAEGMYTVASAMCSHAEGIGDSFSVEITGEASATTYTLAGPIQEIQPGQFIAYTDVIGFKTASQIIAYDSSVPSITVNETLCVRAINNESADIYTLGIASGYASHSEGRDTIAAGDYSHAEGEGTIAAGAYQHVQGKYNLEDTNNSYAHIVGNGVNGNSRSNAHTLDWDGNAWFAGDLSLGGSSMTDFVIEEGNNAHWHYRKWKSGKAECWGSATITGTSPTQLLGGYYSYASAPALPFTFSNVTSMIANGRLGTGIGFALALMNAGTVIIYVVGNTNSNSISYSCHITGSWINSASSNIINFTIGGVSYRATEGMTFQEWVNTEYNTGGFYFPKAGYLVNQNGMFVWDENYTDGIQPEDAINDGEAYVLD